VSTVGIARVPPPAANPSSAAAPAAPPPPPPAEAPRGQQCANVSAASYKMADLKFPANLDAIWTSENYHDFRNPMFGSADMAVFNKTVYDALKPGGMFIVEDHNTAAGAGATVTDKLHRIEKATVIAEVTAAGFKLAGESPVLANPADDHSQGPFALKGTSDKFLLKFRKPRK
jgi:predicted methyltransferase